MYIQSVQQRRLVLSGEKPHVPARLYIHESGSRNTQRGKANQRVTTPRECMSTCQETIILPFALSAAVSASSSGESGLSQKIPFSSSTDLSIESIDLFVRVYITKSFDQHSPGVKIPTHRRKQEEKRKEDACSRHAGSHSGHK